MNQNLAPRDWDNFIHKDLYNGKSWTVLDTHQISDNIHLKKSIWTIPQYWAKSVQV